MEILPKGLIRFCWADPKLPAESSKLRLLKEVKLFLVALSPNRKTDGVSEMN